MRKFFFIFSIILIPIIILLLNFRLYVFNTDYYHKEFARHSVYKMFNNGELENSLDDLFDYFKGKGELNKEFFNSKEILHLKDVKNLIKKTIKLFYISIVLLIIIFILLKDKNLIIKSSLYGSASTIIIILFLFLVSSTNFSWYFLNFHYLVFSNNYWQLNPETDRLILMFPEEFFYDITTKIFFNSLIISLVIMLILYTLKNKFKKSKPPKFDTTFKFKFI